MRCSAQGLVALPISLTGDRARVALRAKTPFLRYFHDRGGPIPPCEWSATRAPPSSLPQPSTLLPGAAGCGGGNHPVPERPPTAR